MTGKEESEQRAGEDANSTPDRPLTGRYAELRAEANALQEKSETLVGHLELLKEHQYSDPKFRLAALNLIEDAEAARRQAEQVATARTQAEQALRENEEQFRRAIQEAPIPVIMHAEDGQVLQVSRAWTELTGFLLEEMRFFQDWVTDYVPEGHAIRERLAGIFSGGARVEEMEIRIITRSGEERHWIFTTSAPGTLRDGRSYAVGMALDITERKRALEALARSEQRLRLVVENAREYAIFSMNMDRTIVSWNPGAERILGYAEPEIVGQPGDIIFTSEDREAGACEREAATALQAGRAADERWHVRKNGTRFWGSGVMMSMRNSDGETIGFVKILRDQTEEKAREEELAASRARLESALIETEQARKEAEEANRTKDTFLAALSHELRTPLMPVLVTAESLLKRKDLPQRVRRGLELICRNVELETHFINDLLDLTRISRGKFDLLREPVDLHAALRAACEICDSDFKSKRQTLSLRLQSGNPIVSGDAARIQQVFWNILKNASKFTTEGGKVEITSSCSSHEVSIRISDSGIGIPPDKLADVFEPFRQASSEITRQYGGLGLGLAICKATVEQLDGTITAESAGAGKGATFTVTLPRRASVP